MNRTRLFGMLALVAAVAIGAWLTLSPSCPDCRVVTEGEAPDPALALIDPSQIAWTQALALTAVHDADGKIILSGSGASGMVTLWQNAKPVSAISVDEGGAFALRAPVSPEGEGAEYFVTAMAADGRLVRSSDAVFLLPGGELLAAGPGRLQRLTGQAADSVTIEAADWDETPALRIAGRAPPAARVRLYLGNRMVGEALARADGTFHLRLIDMSPFGRYALRADVVGDKGEVTARAEVSFERSTPRRMGSGTRLMAEETGGTIRLLRHEPGMGLRESTFFAREGQTRDPAEIRPGQVGTAPGADPVL
ncbi:MAG TPA: hypothetical protein PLA85_11385 [Micropepsaceae bacterium]|nr:hypothetical protein [Micropepsaceae bacterium]